MKSFFHFIVEEQARYPDMSSLLEHDSPCNKRDGAEEGETAVAVRADPEKKFSCD